MSGTGGIGGGPVGGGPDFPIHGYQEADENQLLGEASLGKAWEREEAAYLSTAVRVLNSLKLQGLSDGNNAKVQGAYQKAIQSLQQAKSKHHKWYGRTSAFKGNVKKALETYAKEVASVASLQAGEAGSYSFSRVAEARDGHQIRNPVIQKKLEGVIQARVDAAKEHGPEVAQIVFQSEMKAFMKSAFTMLISEARGEVEGREDLEQKHSDFHEKVGLVSPFAAKIALCREKLAEALGAHGKVKELQEQITALDKEIGSKLFEEGTDGEVQALQSKREELRGVKEQYGSLEGLAERKEALDNAIEAAGGADVEEVASLVAERSKIEATLKEGKSFEEEIAHYEEMEKSGSWRTSESQYMDAGHMEGVPTNARLQTFQADGVKGSKTIGRVGAFAAHGRGFVHSLADRRQELEALVGHLEKALPPVNRLGIDRIVKIKHEIATLKALEGAITEAKDNLDAKIARAKGNLKQKGQLEREISDLKDGIALAKDELKLAKKGEGQGEGAVMFLERKIAANKDLIEGKKQELASLKKEMKKESLEDLLKDRRSLEMQTENKHLLEGLLKGEVSLPGLSGVDVRVRILQAVGKGKTLTEKDAKSLMRDSTRISLATLKNDLEALKADIRVAEASIKAKAAAGKEVTEARAALTSLKEISDAKTKEYQERLEVCQQQAVAMLQQQADHYVNQLISEGKLVKGEGGKLSPSEDFRSSPEFFAFQSGEWCATQLMLVAEKGRELGMMEDNAEALTSLRESLTLSYDGKSGLSRASGKWTVHLPEMSQGAVDGSKSKEPFTMKFGGTFANFDMNAGKSKDPGVQERNRAEIREVTTRATNFVLFNNQLLRASLGTLGKSGTSLDVLIQQATDLDGVKALRKELQKQLKRTKGEDKARIEKALSYLQVTERALNLQKNLSAVANKPSKLSAESMADLGELTDLMGGVNIATCKSAKDRTHIMVAKLAARLVNRMRTRARKKAIRGKKITARVVDGVGVKVAAQNVGAEAFKWKGGLAAKTILAAMVHGPFGAGARATARWIRALSVGT